MGKHQCGTAGHTKRSGFDMSTMTIDFLREAVCRVERLRPKFSGRVFFNVNCLRETTERTFPASKHRSARIRKKLIKQHGSEFKKTPAIFLVDGDFYAHPIYRQKIAEAMGREFS